MSKALIFLIPGIYGCLSVCVCRYIEKGIYKYNNCFFLSFGILGGSLCFKCITVSLISTI
ncbi:hypothetical protein CLU79DRAFT_757683 [Phycomyces nitens]|nr:hypothetical protein CLU79DRAFT_757683 [Phycomyces nitens]